MTPPPPPPGPADQPLLDRIRAATAGRYEVIAELGVGGMATVFRAREIALERDVAIKVMSVEMATSPGAFERFRREARVAAALDHPHIVPIYAIGEDPALPFFAMKFIEGRGLDSILKRSGHQPVEDVARTIGVVGRALHHAHTHGVVHRDVKPANIMVGNDGWVYVTDFGIAKRDDVQGLTQAGTVIGTPAYMSPEQFNGAEITGAADQYSLGVVAYEMLAGRTPFDSPSLGEIMKGHLLDAPPPIRALRVDVPTTVADVVNRMLEKEVGKRFPTLGEAVKALESAAAAAKANPGRRSFVNAPHQSPQMDPTTPIPKPSPAVITAASRKAATATQPRPAAVPAEPRRSLVLPLLLLLLMIGGGAWFAMYEGLIPAIPGVPGIPAASGTATGLTVGADNGMRSGVASAGDAAAAPSPAATGAAADSSGTTEPAASADSTASRAAIDSAIAALAARAQAEAVVDGIAPPDSVVVRAGSQMPETVLFVNDQQVGIVGGRGLLETTVAPGRILVSVRKRNCRSWDSTFTLPGGRRITFGERSPSC